MKFRARDGDYCKVCGSYLPPDHDWYYCSDCGENPFCSRECYHRHRKNTGEDEQRTRRKEQTEFGGIRIDMSGIAQYAGAGAGGDVSVNIGEGSITRRRTTVDNRGGLIQRSAIGGSEERMRICPYCGEELDFLKPPRFCPHCGEPLK